MLDKQKIKACILKGSRGKKHRRDVRAVLQDVDGYTDKIYRLLETDTYVPTRPRKIHIRDKSSRKERDIKVVPYYPDGIIQRLVVEAMQDVLMRGMYRWSCASIPGRGNKCAADYVKKHLKRDRKGTKYCGKFDIHHYYPSVNRRHVMRALNRKIKDKRLLRLIEDIINSDPDPGLSIGFYLNQWLANFLLEPLDHFICHIPGVKYYVRNMDDIVILGPNKKKLHRAREMIDRFLATMLGLKLKGNWQVFPTDSRGIDFVGYRFFHSRTMLRKRNLKKLRRNARTAMKFARTNRKIPYHVAAGLLSRSGELKHCNGHGLMQEYVEAFGVKKLKNIIRLHTQTERRKHEDQAFNGAGNQPRGFRP